MTERLSLCFNIFASIEIFRFQIKLFYDYLEKNNLSFSAILRVVCDASIYYYYYLLEPYSNLRFYEFVFEGIFKITHINIFIRHETFVIPNLHHGFRIEDKINQVRI